MQGSSEEIILKSGRKVTKFRLENDNHMVVEAISIGATLTQIIVPDAQGTMENVILGWQDLNHYEEHPGAFGAVVGRVAGRIYKGQVTLGGKAYHFPINSFDNTLHGGERGFHKRDWQGEIMIGEQESAIKWHYFSEDGEEGFPGNLQVTVTYTLNNQNELRLSYHAVTDQETVVNLTNHAYFNLSGNGKEDVLEQEVWMDSDWVYDLDEELIPVGTLRAVKEDPCFDFTQPKKIGQDIDKKHKALEEGMGYDHIWKLNQGKEAITLYDQVSRREMVITTTEPAVVMYTMNHADQPYVLENGNCQQPRFAVCFETQKPAVGYNEVNKEEIVLKPGETYNQETLLSFKIR